jgi:phospholipid/cholesterol/gamma-HCH transport system ATP-binding protein
MMHDGKIVWAGDVENIDNSGNKFIDQFIHGRVDGPMTTELAGVGRA